MGKQFCLAEGVCLCGCSEPDSNIEAALMKDVEMVDEQHQQLTELVDISQAQNTQLRQLMSLPPTADDIRPSSVDISAVMAQASMGKLWVL